MHKDIDDLVQYGMDLLDQYPDHVRTPIFKDSKKDLASLGSMILVSMGTGELAQFVNLINVVLETAFCLGYQEGKDEIPVDDIWRGD